MVGKGWERSFEGDFVVRAVPFDFFAVFGEEDLKTAVCLYANTSLS